MDFFFVEYRDPLFGLIFLVILILVVAVAHLIWRFFADKNENASLEIFIKKFELDNAQKALLKSPTLSLNNLLFLAEVFTKSGEFEKATQIYLITLEKTRDKNEQSMILLALAKVYFKAGFLAKAKEVLLNLLKNRPRNEEALNLLKIIHLKLREFKDALSVLECLFELENDVKNEQEFIKALLIESKNIDKNAMKNEILELKLNDNAPLKRFVYEKFEVLLKQDLSEICDLLYKKDESKLNEIKSTRLDMLKCLRENNFKAKLSFSYVCLECKNAMPLFFYHCPVCHKFGTCKIIYELKADEEN